MNKDEKSYRILVIEDNRGDFALVEDFITEKILQPEIVHAHNFNHACKILASEGVGFSVILLDLSLPDKKGSELIGAMLRKAPSCPIIILTGYEDIGFSISSISQGIFDYLLKDDLSASILYKSILYAIERKKTVTELTLSEKRYSDLFHLSNQPMWVYDPETLRFIQVNRAAIELYGYSEQEFLNMTIVTLRSNNRMTGKEERNHIAESTDKINSLNCIHYRKSGEMIKVEIFGNPIYINHKYCRSEIVINVTEKHLYEDKLIKAVLKTQEDERYEIGGELHDNVCQILAASQIVLDTLVNSIPSEKMTAFKKCKEYIVLASSEIRNISHRLAPAFFDDIPLEQVFRKLLASFNLDEKHTVLLYMDASVSSCPLSIELQLTLYRILQEQLRNIVNYSHASVIEIKVSIDEGQLTMIVRDNGVGFFIDTAKCGIGLSNMKRRAELLSGNLQIDSSPGTGCKITVAVPLSEQTVGVAKEPLFALQQELVNIPN
jgi:PAS domain S-box-containing protein